MSKGKPFEILAGHAHQLGANYDGEGVNFAIFPPTRNVLNCVFTIRPVKLKLPGAICRNVLMKCGTATCRA